MSDLVSLARVIERSEALIIRGLLESAGVPSVVPELDTLGAAPHLILALGGYRILVLEEDLAEARAILADAQGGGLAQS